MSGLILALGEAYSLIIIVYVLLSWLPTDRGILKDVNDVLARVCDPYLNLFKRIVPPIGGMVDISPIDALLILHDGGWQLARLLAGIKRFLACR